jgi:ribonuclease J
MSEPFSEEDLEPKVLQNWLSHFGLRLHQIHASGHCPSRDLAKIIETINPEKIVPIHTEHPDLFQEKFRNRHVTLVKEGEKIRL